MLYNPLFFRYEDGDEDEEDVDELDGHLRFRRRR